MLQLNLLKNFYYKSPQIFKKLVSWFPDKWKYGKDYNQWVKFLNNSIDEDEYRLNKLRETLIVAYNTTKYYKRLFDQAGFHLQDFNDLKYFQQIPFLTKEIILDNFTNLVNENLKMNQIFYVTTGGTSGKPTRFLQSKNVWSKEVAFFHDIFSKIGYKKNSLKASFRGGEFDKLKANEYWIYNPINNEINFSPFHLNQKTVKYYVNKLNETQPRYFHSYPSAITLFLKLMLEEKLKLNYEVHGVLLISEPACPEQIELIKREFSCKVISFYGHSERAILARGVINQNFYKIDKRYGFFELIDENCCGINENNKIGEVVGTTFDNYAMPLIRYKTGDFTQFINSEDSIIDGIKGKWLQEFLVGKENTVISLTALNLHSNVFNNVIETQFIQNEPGKVILNIVTTKNFKLNDKFKLSHKLNEKVGNLIEFNIRVVNSLEKTERGKTKYLIKNF